MTRRGLREQVFKMLFRVEFHNVEDMPEQMNMFEEVEECSEKDKEYISNKFHNIVEKIDDIDAAINEVSEGWKTRRMGKVDLTDEECLFSWTGEYIHQKYVCPGLYDAAHQCQGRSV